MSATAYRRPDGVQLDIEGKPHVIANPNRPAVQMSMSLLMPLAPEPLRDQTTFPAPNDPATLEEAVAILRTPLLEPTTTAAYCISCGAILPDDHDAHCFRCAEALTKANALHDDAQDLRQIGCC